MCAQVNLSINETMFQDMTTTDTNVFTDRFILGNGTNRNDSESSLDKSFANWELIVISVFAGTLAFITMFGNLLVMISFGINQKLRILNNYFLASLSVADFSIGLVSMPLYTTYILVGHWPFGAVPCDLWLSMDYVMSNSSALHLLVICIDRYLTLKKPLSYRAEKTSGKLLRMIISVWIISIFLWVPWIFAYPYIEGGRTVPDTDCYIQFLSSNPYLTVATHVLAYWLPIFGMIVFYQRVYHAAAKHVAFKSNFTIRRGDAPSGSNAELVTTTPGRRDMRRSVSTESTVSTISNASVYGGNYNHKSHYHDKDGDKAAKTLSAILLAFILTWTPYHVNVIISTVCSTCVPQSVFHFGKCKITGVNK